jgi:hypothetical protein
MHAMPNRYEREIDEILSRMDSRPTVSERLRALGQRPARRRGGAEFRFGGDATLLLGAVLAVVASALKWIVQTPSGIINIVIAALAVASFVIIVASLIWQWRPRSNRPHMVWRGQDLGPLERPRRSPFADMLTRWNLIRLRMSYRRRNLSES